VPTTSTAPPASELQPLDPVRVLRHPQACAALTEVAAELRAARYDGSPDARPLLSAARGEVVAPDALRAALGDDRWAALTDAGVVFVHADGDAAALTAKVFPMRSVLTLLPRSVIGEDIVYLGRDSVLLMDVVWKRGGIGRRAVDLGTGNGFIAAALATRFDHVVAADLSERCAATAQLVTVLNPHLAGRCSAARLDVAAGLRAGSFDLVTANAPWVPEVEGPDGGPPRLFAAGGPTGFELPRRFLDQAVELLAPGGRAFVACMDIELADGRRPVVEHLPVLEAQGVAVEAVDTHLDTPEALAQWAEEKAPGARGARHVVVHLRRPPTT
jgi:SAM-dependent methyltransferase